CSPETRGEIVVTGGRNPFLPLLRYRTGDSAGMAFGAGAPRLLGLEGRLPVLFKSATGKAINNMDVTQAMESLSFPQFSLHQHADGWLRCRVRGHASPRDAIHKALRDLFGYDQQLTIEEIPDADAWSGKILQYSSEA